MEIDKAGRFIEKFILGLVSVVTTYHRHDRAGQKKKISLQNHMNCVEFLVRTLKTLSLKITNTDNIAGRYRGLVMYVCESVQLGLWELHCLPPQWYRTTLCITELHRAPPTCIVLGFAVDHSRDGAQHDVVSLAVIPRVWQLQSDIWLGFVSSDMNRGSGLSPTLPHQITDTNHQWRRHN